MKLLDLPQAVRERRMFGFFDDFEWYLAPHRWTSLTADAGTSVAVGSTTPNGAVVLTTAAVDNSECGVGTTTRPLRPADDKPLMLEGRIQYTEAALNAANVFVGVADTLTAADLLLDNGQGPRPGLNGAGVYKVDGESTWRVVSVRGGVPLVTVTAIPAGGPVPQTLRVEIAAPRRLDRRGGLPHRRCAGPRPVGPAGEASVSSRRLPGAAGGGVPQGGIGHRGIARG